MSNEMRGSMREASNIHLHDPGELGAFQIELIAERTKALGLQGRVAISHAFCLGMLDGDRFATLVTCPVDNHIAIMTHAPGARAFPPIRPLRAAGVTLFSGSDGVRDAWTPYGNADMLEGAMLLGYRSAFRRDEEILLALEMVTAGGAAVMRRSPAGRCWPASSPAGRSTPAETVSRRGGAGTRRPRPSFHRTGYPVFR